MRVRVDTKFHFTDADARQVAARVFVEDDGIADRIQKVYGVSLSVDRRHDPITEVAVQGQSNRLAPVLTLFAALVENYKNGIMPTRSQISKIHEGKSIAPDFNNHIRGVAGSVPAPAARHAGGQRHAQRHHRNHTT